MDNLPQLAAEYLQLFAIYSREFALQFTYAFRPVHRDYEMIFQPEKAHKLFDAYESEFWSCPESCMIETGNFNRTEMLVTSFSTQMLRDGDEAALDSLPGGYSDVVPHYRTDTDILLMKVSFVEPGEPYGMDYDGFYFLNQRFIWIPKPWRIIERLE